MNSGKKLLCIIMTAIAAVALLTFGAMAETYQVINESELVDRISNAADGDVITLQYDITLTSSLEISNGNSFTIDLGGGCLYGRVNIRNGTDVTIQNGTLINYDGQALNVYASGNSSDPTTVVVESSVGVYQSSYGLCVFPDGSSGEGINITVNGNIVAGCGIFVNGLITSCSSDDIITVNGTVTGTDSDGVGIALNGFENLVVSSTATVSGPTGIEVRAGNLTVESGATVTATATEFDIEANSNGTTSLGAGIAVVQHTTKLPITVTVDGGTISGVYAIYEYDIQGNNDEADITITVNGGTLSGTTAAISTETENLTVSTSVSLTGSTNLVAQVGDTKYASLEAAFAAAGDGSTVTLLADVTLSESLVIDLSGSATLDLSGHTITFAYDSAGQFNGTTLTDGDWGLKLASGTLTIMDSVGGGGIKTADENSYVDPVGASGSSTLIINSGEFSTNSIYEAVVFASGTATVNIYGGTFTNEATSYAYNSDFSGIVLNVGNSSEAKIYVYGGTFVGESPESGDDSSSAGLTQTTFVPSGYTAVEVSSGTYMIQAVQTSPTTIGPFYLNEIYHGTIINGQMVTAYHILNADGYCVVCGHHIETTSGETAAEITEETVVIDDPVESTDTETEEDTVDSSEIETPIETETESNPTTGVALSLLPLAMAALAAAVTKK